jgi:hypothetical protein
LPRNEINRTAESERDIHESVEISLFDELKAKEAELVGVLKPIREQYERLTIELEMVQHGLVMLAPKKPRQRGPLPDTLLDEAETMRSEGIIWEDVARKLNVKVTALQKATERRRKGNPHRKQSIAGRSSEVSASG